jgi:hypothetical protein
MVNQKEKKKVGIVILKNNVRNDKMKVNNFDQLSPPNTPLCGVQKSYSFSYILSLIARPL